jgi:hypothetical protein
MTQHTLQGRTEEEVMWWRRRSVLQAAAAWVGGGGYAGAIAQQRGNIVELQGEATVNGRKLGPNATVVSGDQIETGVGTNLIFVIGNSSFQVRQNTRMAVERGPTINAISLLRLITGAVVSVWGKGLSRQIVTPTLTAGIRGTGVYTEVFPQMDNRSYFCNCYGTVDMDAGTDHTVSQSSYHQSFWGEPAPKNGRMLTPANAINHTDEELEFLARLVDQQTAWQIMGRKGVKNGMGYMDTLPGQVHPAMMIGK